MRYRLQNNWWLWRGFGHFYREERRVWLYVRHTTPPPSFNCALTDNIHLIRLALMPLTFLKASGWNQQCANVLANVQRSSPFELIVLIMAVASCCAHTKRPTADAKATHTHTPLPLEDSDGSLLGNKYRNSMICNDGNVTNSLPRWHFKAHFQSNQSHDNLCYEHDNLCLLVSNMFHALP